MMNNQYHTERRYLGRPIIIDLAPVDGMFEAIVMTPDGEALEYLCTESLEDAVSYYNAMLTKYPESPAPLTGKYAKLRDDLKKALAAGRVAEVANPEDGGTCNFDAASIFLPRWNESKVEQAAQEAGTHCYTWKLYGGKRFVFSPITGGQGNARSRNAEAMTASLKAAGYDAMDYAQMD